MGEHCSISKESRSMCAIGDDSLCEVQSKAKAVCDIRDLYCFYFFYQIVLPNFTCPCARSTLSVTCLLADVLLESSGIIIY